MKDPKRLLDGDGTEFERALLGAIADERPTRDLHRKMRLGIGLVGVGAVAKAASASWNQLALAGVVVAGLVTGGAVVARHEINKHRAEDTVALAVTVPAPAPAPVRAQATPVEPIPVTLPEIPKSEERARGAVKAQAPVADIREEIRLLDQARSAVRGGKNSQALRTLAKYEQRFPRGQFRQEVQVLRMEALKQSGEADRAAVLAKKFLAEHPNSPHVERVEHVGEK